MNFQQNRGEFQQNRGEFSTEPRWIFNRTAVKFNRTAVKFNRTARVFKRTTAKFNRTARFSAAMGVCSGERGVHPRATCQQQRNATCARTRACCTHARSRRGIEQRAHSELRCAIDHPFQIADLAVTVAVLQCKNSAERHSRNGRSTSHNMTDRPEDITEERRDTAAHPPFAARSTAMISAAIGSLEALRSLQVGVLLRA